MLVAFCWLWIWQLRPQNGCGKRKVLNKPAEWQTQSFSGHFTGFIKTTAWNPQGTLARECWSPNVDRSKHVGAFIQNSPQLNRACQRALLFSLLSPPLPIPKKSHWQCLIIEIIVHKHIIVVFKERMSWWAAERASLTPRFNDVASITQNAVWSCPAGGA